MPSCLPFALGREMLSKCNLRRCRRKASNNTAAGGEAAEAQPMDVEAQAVGSQVGAQAVGPQAVEAQAAEAQAVEAQAAEAQSMDVEAQAVKALAVKAQAVKAQAVKAQAIGAQTVEAQSVEAQAVGAQAVGAQAAAIKVEPSVPTRPRPRTAAEVALLTDAELGRLEVGNIVVVMSSEELLKIGSDISSKMSKPELNELQLMQHKLREDPALTPFEAYRRWQDERILQLQNEREALIKKEKAKLLQRLKDLTAQLPPSMAEELDEEVGKRLDDLVNETLRPQRKRDPLVKELIADQPMTRRAAWPKWGQEFEYMREEQQSETSDSKRARPDAEQLTHDRLAATHSHWVDFMGEDVEEWSDASFQEFLFSAPDNLVTWILNTSADRVCVSRLSGVALAEAVENRSTRNPAVVEDILQREVWGLLDRLTVEPDSKFFLDTMTGAAAVCSALPLPPQYKGTIHIDRVIITDLEQRHFRPRDMYTAPSQTSDLVGVVAVDIEPDYVCPLPFQPERGDEYNADIKNGFVRYLKSKLVSLEDKRKYNPVSQSGSCGYALGVKNVAICTINTMTYGEVQVCDDPRAPGRTVHRMRITKSFDWTDKETGLVDKNGKNMSHWEVLLRFLIATLRSTKLDRGIPDSFKAKAKAPTKGKQDGGGGGGTKSKEDDHIKEEFGRLYWEDLWDERRFAVPATHSLAEECTPEKLPGDAEEIRRSHIGPTYRKTIRGVDARVKVALVFDEERSRDDPLFEEILDDLALEARVYSRLQNIQGRFVPRFVWHGDVIQGMIAALVTEYTGAHLGRHGDECTEEVAARAVEALDAIHAQGVLHRNIAIRNILLDSSGKVTIMNFTMSKIRGEDVSEEEFEQLALQERTKMQDTLSNMY